MFLILQKHLTQTADVPPSCGDCQNCNMKKVKSKLKIEARKSEIKSNFYL